MMEENQISRTIEVDIEDEMKKSFLDYSMSVIVARALPDVRDGLKPVHRRILYTMHENSLTPDKAYRKCADTVGSVLGRYHPHGDASVYDALVRLAQDFSMRYILVDGHGNFGSVDGDPAAAYRYTEARMSKMALHMLADIDKETVNFASNYDDRLQEPVVLPSRYPNLLVNGSIGIAVGMATNIPPHNLGEVIEGAKLLIDDPEATLEQLMEKIKGPDFPTGGIIMGRSGIRAAYATGRGKLTLRGRAEILENTGGKNQIQITEIPYGVNKARMIEHIAELVKDKRIEGISNISDHSDRKGMSILVDLKRDANAQVVLNQLYTYSQLQETVGVIMLALVNGEPKVLSLKEMLQHYIDFQCEVIVRRTQYDLRKAKERAHILEGLRKALDFIDEVIAILRASRTVPEGKSNLMERFDFSEEQASAIVAMTLGRLTGLEREKILEELEGILVRIADMEDILANHSRVLAIIKTELETILQKFADPRRTEIGVVTGEVDIEDLIPNEECVITLTHCGYIKRQPTDVYKAQHRGGRGITGMTTREEDFAEEMFTCSSHDYVMFFTNFGLCYRLKAYEIAESGRTSKGTNIVNLIQIESGEKITSMIRVSQYDDDSYLMMFTKMGIVKRTHLSYYRNVRKNGLISISLDKGDELCSVRQTNGANQLIVATKNGMVIRFAEEDVRAVSRTARGVRAIHLRNGDTVVGAARIREDATLLTVSEGGSGRRTKLDQYRLQSRGGLGVRNYNTDKRSLVAGIKIVDEDDDVILISDDGIIIRIPVSDITVQSRYGGGVRVMRLAEGSKVVTLARTPKEEEKTYQESVLNCDGKEDSEDPFEDAEDPLEEIEEEILEDFPDDEE